MTQLKVGWKAFSIRKRLLNSRNRADRTNLIYRPDIQAISPKENAISECHDLFGARLKPLRSLRCGLSIRRWWRLVRSGKERDRRCICRVLMGGLLILSPVVGLIERFFQRLVTVIEVCVCVCSSSV